jgi:hypothetical protein
MDLSLYKQASSVRISGNGNPEFGGDFLPYPSEGRPIITAATFDPGAILEITPDFDKLRAAGATIEGLREACYFRRLSGADRTVEILEKKHLERVEGIFVPSSSPGPASKNGSNVPGTGPAASPYPGGVAPPSGMTGPSPWKVVIDRPKRRIDLATVAAIRAVRMTPRTIRIRLNDGRGLRILPDIEKIAPYLITLEDFELELTYPADFDVNPLAVADPAKVPFLVPVRPDAAQPGKFLVLGGLRVTDSRLPHYFVMLDPKGGAGFPIKADTRLFPGQVLIQVSLGVPLESVARVEVVPVRKIHGVMADPFAEKPEEDFIVRAAGVIEAVQARVKEDPILGPLAGAVPKSNQASWRSRLLGVPDKDSNRYVCVRTETPEAWDDFPTKSLRGPAPRVHGHGWLSIEFSERPSRGMPACPFVPPRGCYYGSTQLSIPGSPAEAYVDTLSSDRQAHRRLINILTEESAKMGIRIKAKGDDPFVSRGSASQPPPPVRPGVTPGYPQPIQPGPQRQPTP